jgi:hypothetical protein
MCTVIYQTEEVPMATDPLTDPVITRDPTVVEGGLPSDAVAPLAEVAPEAEPPAEATTDPSGPVDRYPGGNARFG